MGGNVGAPVSTVLQLDPSVTADQVTLVLAEWLRRTHGVALQSADHDGLVVEWRTTEQGLFACQLVASDSTDEARRTITVVCDDAGGVAIVEETPFAAADAPHANMDLSAPVRELLSLLQPMALPVQDLVRGSVNDLQKVDSAGLAGDLSGELAPGLLIAVVAGDGALTAPQAELFNDLAGLAVIGTVPAGNPLLSEAGLSTQPRPGSIISVARSGDGLDTQMIASTSLRTKLDSARRLILRHQLAAPVPFDLERRRSTAMTRLLTGSTEIDLPAALQLLDEESERASEFGSRVKELELLLELAYDEQDTALSELDNAQSQVRYLQKAFKAVGEVPIVESEENEDWLPESSAAALVAAREWLPFLIIGATDDACHALDTHQKRGIWAKKIWSSLRALNDYCKAKAEGRFSGDIATYRGNTPDGAVPLLAEYAPVESKSTTDDTDLVAVRTFPVPKAVAPFGKAYMQQHVKIDKGGQSAPRIHLHDDSAGLTERIYVGYVGPHLPTSTRF